MVVDAARGEVRTGQAPEGEVCAVRAAAHRVGKGLHAAGAEGFLRPGNDGGMPLDDVIGETILGMRECAGAIGLDGSLAAE